MNNIEDSLTQLQCDYIKKWRENGMEVICSLIDFKDQYYVVVQVYQMTKIGIAIINSSNWCLVERIEELDLEMVDKGIEYAEKINEQIAKGIQFFQKMKEKESKQANANLN